jgi:hypothetical protein
VYTGKLEVVFLAVVGFNIEVVYERNADSVDRDRDDKVEEVFEIVLGEVSEAVPIDMVFEGLNEDLDDRLDKVLEEVWMVESAVPVTTALVKGVDSLLSGEKIGDSVNRSIISGSGMDKSTVLVNGIDSPLPGEEVDISGVGRATPSVAGWTHCHPTQC